MYREHRIAQVQALKATQQPPYPHKFHVELSLSDYIDKYEGLEEGSRLEDTMVTIAGVYLNPPLYLCLVYLVCSKAVVSTYL